jgi:hypothetical protein
MRFAPLVFLAALGTSHVVLAQATGPGGVPMAPGPSQPPAFTPGGIGPGGGRVAPGPAAGNVNIERIGPGGGRLAPGPVVVPSSRDSAGTVKVKRRPFSGKGKRPRTVKSIGRN